MLGVQCKAAEILLTCLGKSRNLQAGACSAESKEMVQQNWDLPVTVPKFTSSFSAWNEQATYKMTAPGVCLHSTQAHACAHVASVHDDHACKTAAFATATSPREQLPGTHGDAVTVRQTTAHSCNQIV